VACPGTRTLQWERLIADPPRAAGPSVFSGLPEARVLPSDALAAVRRFLGRLPGCGCDQSEFGAIINERQYNKVCGYIEDGMKQSGSKLICGGHPRDDNSLGDGYYLRPTIFAQGSNNWRLAREEIFGPVLVAIPWDDEDDVIRMANDSHYGLAAYVFTHDIGKALRAARDIEAGWVQVNQGTRPFLRRLQAEWSRS
jgi:acyl-CoA reductase-like NAD-dependent aldehyde dehydrogenase